ncbi:MAG: type III-B CRISPR-associated protein Cas10/Cmr2 [Cyanobacteria bacterium J06606_4]
MPNVIEETWISVGLAWCLAYSQSQSTQSAPSAADISKATLTSWRASLCNHTLPTDKSWQTYLDTAEAVKAFFYKNDENGQEISRERSPGEISQCIKNNNLTDTRIGLIYGGVTRVKGYIFESANLQEIRGGSALLDRINLKDLRAIFEGEQFRDNNENVLLISDKLSQALIPQLIVYSTGGNILALCPEAHMTELTNAIEKRYAQETLTADACAVGEAFNPVELYAGLLSEKVLETPWEDDVIQHRQHNPILSAYFSLREGDSDASVKKAFYRRKNFGELVGRLTNQFNQRRNGTDSPLAVGRPSRRYPPMFETHPYLKRDDSDARSAIAEVKDLTDQPLTLSEPSARKRWVGQKTKREEQKTAWANYFCGEWTPTQNQKAGEAAFESWVSRFETFLAAHLDLRQKYDPDERILTSQGKLKSEVQKTREARSLHEIGASSKGSKGYVAYIYADGNNMGKYIRDTIHTPEAYRRFSQDVFDATEQSVYRAIAAHLHPYEYEPDAKSSRYKKGETGKVWIHPFEIVTIGGDDVLLIVPAQNAVEVAYKLGIEFENILLTDKKGYQLKEASPHRIHRYRPDQAAPSKCKLSTSSGVLITAANTPIYYANDLVTQLQKSAKQYRKQVNHPGGTVDLFVLKAVTMLSARINKFREQGLEKQPSKARHKLKLYGAPYTLHDLNGLIGTVKALKRSSFPKSQLYQLRSLLERGKRTAILNYRYFRVRLSSSDQALLREHFEEAWCKAETNDGNIAPWMTIKQSDNSSSDTDSRKETPTKASVTTYETIWRELVELLPFIELEPADETTNEPAPPATAPNQEATP